MSTVFGEVAALYDAARPDYPAEITDVVLRYAGRPPATMAEIGAGTGKATALFAGRDIAITCVEPDPRMSALLVARFPAVSVVTSTFEGWTPPAEGFDLVVAALSWHWLDPATRAHRAAAALSPGGTLALIGRRTAQDDPEVHAALGALFARFGPDAAEKPPFTTWALPELTEFADVTTWETTEVTPTTTEALLSQFQTYGPFRKRPPGEQQEVLAALRETFDAYADRLRTRLDTTVILARKPR